MKKTITLMILLLICTVVIQAQTIFEEKFESGSLPTGWSNETKSSDGGWKIGTPQNLSSQYFGIKPNGSGNIAATNDDMCNCDKSTDFIITPAIDLSGYTSIVLSFDAFFNGAEYQGALEKATIEISTDNETWQILEDMHGHGSWDTHNINLTEYAGQTIYIGFKYNDGGGWLFGMGIDNVVVKVPAAIDANLVNVKKLAYGEVGNIIPIKGTIFNNGITEINSIKIGYTINGVDKTVEIKEGLSIPAFEYAEFRFDTDWIPDNTGDYIISVSIDKVNTVVDENNENDILDFEATIYEPVIRPNIINEILESIPVITEIASSSNLLNKPTDLDFFPILGRDELWIVNQRTEDEGGSTLTISDAANDPNNYELKVDGNSWHFMSLPTAIAFSDDNFNFATTPGVKDANHNGGTFTGPSLWSSDADIYAKDSGGNGSHLDMLHGSPFSMGIAHEVDNTFWVYDNWNKDIVRYDFKGDHGPGNDDHSDAVVRRYKNIGISADGDIPNHMILDKETGWLYIVDNGNDRVLRLDINSGNPPTSLEFINEELAEHSQVSGFNYEVIVADGLEQPSGIEIIGNRLLVGDYNNGDIVVYDMDNNFVELGRIQTLNKGLTGIKVGPNGNIWYTNRINNIAEKLEVGELNATNKTALNSLKIKLSPNPTSDWMRINFSDFNLTNNIKGSIVSTTGQLISVLGSISNNQNIDVSDLRSGVYLLKIESNDFNVIKKIIIQK